MSRASSRQARLFATVTGENGRIVTPHPAELARQRIAAIDKLRPSPKADRARGVSPWLHDSFKRPHDYLRISLTEKCNLRCTYCMPEQGVDLLPRDDLLTADEIERMAAMFVQAGVRKVRLTGGEPTVRRDLVDIVARLGRMNLDSLGVTSNGIALHRKLKELIENGLTSANISLDTLDPFKFELMTRRRGHSAVLNSIERGLELKRQGYPFQLKVNVVVVNGLNDAEVIDFVELTKDKDLTVRFIEYMPFEDNRWSTEKMVPSATLVERIRTRLPTLEKLYDDKHDTTRSWQVPGYKGKVGFISSMSDHFCGGCSRLRVSADGNMKVCLFGPPALPLRPMLRSGQSDETILRAIGTALQGKKWAHDGLGSPSGIAKHGQSGPMVAIGG